MEARNEVLARIVEIVASVEKKDARFISVATVLGSVLRRVLSTQKSSLAARDLFRAATPDGADVQGNVRYDRNTRCSAA